MNKYVIKNCECKVKGKTTLCVRDIPYKKCENITDCKLKQIVEKCRSEINLRPDANIDDDFAKEILELLDIQGVECEKKN